MSNADRIEKQVVLRAPRPRVWKAIADHDEFGSWFGVKWAGPFVAGQRNVAVFQMPGYEGREMEVWVDAVEPETRFSYRWHPNAIDESVDYSAEPTTLVEFRLEDAAGGTRLTVTESGFEGVPVSRRLDAFRGNSEGWGIQMERIANYVDGVASARA